MPHKCETPHAGGASRDCFGGPSRVLPTSSELRTQSNALRVGDYPFRSFGELSREVVAQALRAVTK